MHSIKNSVSGDRVREGAYFSRAGREAQLHELEMARINANNPRERVIENNGRKFKKINIPKLDDSCDPEMILIAFDRACNLYGITDEEKVSEILPFLEGKALSAYTKLNEEDSKNYVKLKDAILKAFQLTAQQHRVRFRELNKKSNESYCQLAARMSERLGAWIRSSEAEGDFEKFREMILLEQFMNNLSTDLKIWISDRDCKTVSEASTLADRYMEARGRNEYIKREETKFKTVGKYFGHKENKTYSFGKPNIKESNAEKENIKDNFVSHKRNSNNNKDMSHIKCFKCSKYGHYASSCEDKLNKHENKKVYFIGASDKNLDKDYQGRIVINGKSMKSYRDTGTFLSIVPKRIVKKHQYTGEHARIRTIAGVESDLPLADVKVEREGKEQIVTVAVLDNNEISVIEGNDIGNVLVPSFDKEILKNAEVEGKALNTSSENAYIRNVIVNDKFTDMLRDSGSQISIVNKKLVYKSQYINDKVTVQSITGKTVDLPMAKVKIEDDTGIRDLKVAISENIPFGLLAGNDYFPVMKEVNNFLIMTRSKAKKDSNDEKEENDNSQIEREMKKKSRILKDKEIDKGKSKIKGKIGINKSENNNNEITDSNNSEKVDDKLELILDSEEFKRIQRNDKSLKELWERASDIEEDKEDESTKLIIENGILTRIWKCKKQGMKEWKQILVPIEYREKVLEMAHSNILAGHLGKKKTRDRLLKNFFWPSVFKDVDEYVSACETCQLTKKGNIVRAPLKNIPTIDIPFSRQGIDLVGPLPETSNGNKYILVVCDYATKWPYAVALPSIDSEKIVTELIKHFTNVGFPNEIICDNGKQFVSQLTKGLWERTGVKLKTSSVYRPQTNGLTEKYNGTLKNVLKALIERYEKDWDDLLEYALFAYREILNESTGFSPFELVYGREARGPLDLLKQAWTGQKEEKQSVVTYFRKLRTDMVKAVRIANKNAKNSQEKQKTWYDKKARLRKFNVGQKVLILKPIRENCLDVAWQGPYEITKKVSELNYEVYLEELDENKVYHINMIKPWRVRSPIIAFAQLEETESNTENLDSIIFWKSDKENVKFEINEKLTRKQKKELEDVLNNRASVLNSKPGLTDWEEHAIELTDSEPLRIRQYRIPIAAKEELDRQISEMLDLNIIEESKSHVISPIILVPKKDSKEMRFCVDFRDINKKTKGDFFPCPNIEETLTGLGKAKYFTKIDLSKGFWQIPLKPESRKLTAFRTDKNVYQFKVMPFGAKNSSSSFVRLMSKVLNPFKEFAKSYIDDILIFSESWEEHLVHIGKVLDRLKEAGLTAKPEKCKFGMDSINFLGYNVGPGGIKPDEAKIKSIKDWPIPRTKKQVKAFIGTASYYRKFIKNFSEIASDLTDLTKKNMPNIIKWTPECNKAFNTLKQKLITPPILVSPNHDDKFIVQCDASDKGLGCVLAVVNNKGEEKPVIYLSRKLSVTEQSYSVIEKECLCIVWALDKLRPYLFGNSFVIQTDHNPLVWLNSMKDKNRKILRWTLLLNEFDFEIKYKKGTTHTNADGLSRQ